MWAYNNTQINDDYIYSDTLIHGHKYIDKYRSKKTGKWVYVYTKAGYTRHTKDPITGKKTTIRVPDTKVYVRNSDDLFSSTRTVTNGTGTVRNEYREIGKIDRSVEKAADNIYKTSTDITRKVKDLSESCIRKGKEFINKIFG